MVQERGVRASSRTPSPPPKFHRALSPSRSSRSFICVLPPTCSQPDTSTYYATQAELDKHQETFHKWICHVPVRDREREYQASKGQSGGKEKEREDTPVIDGVPESFVAGRIKDGKRWKECSKVFPDERLLTLHHTEVHDPIARQQKDNGQKIFECFLPPSQCGKRFIDPKRRRRHLIDKHKYPHQYFFSITNHGDGLAISMIRPRRDRPQPPEGDMNSPPGVPLAGPSSRADPPDGAAELKRLVSGDGAYQEQERRTPDIDMDDLSAKMGSLESSLTFVPRGVRAKQAALTKRNQGGDRMVMG
ncbi:hypothetical protein I316_03519 [Kwoniella heveanensis BCC8398]|uniref:C2H2-type domain-containing protein n=1 Tax=Kwoniella heveanensis BCC8398 TaxID=1296120 RepID=A0A1B9GVC9_9TREE|nr:hypothetical protein I316_03519 [Kwoniella heveanensis BCC8398]